jgi:hypothetical protein
MANFPLGLTDIGVSDEFIKVAIRNGQGFYVSTDKYTPGATNNAFSIFNPNGSGKTLVLFSLIVYYTTAGQNIQCRIVNANPSLATILSAANFNLGNLLAGSANASIASVTYANATTNPPALTAASLAFESTSNISNNPFDLFTPPNILILPPNTGLATYINNAASGSLSFNAKWIEI